MTVTTILCKILAYNPNIDLKGKFHICCPYFIFYFKDIPNTITASKKLSFRFILGLLDVLATNFVLKHLVSQDIDLGIFLVLTLTFYSYVHYMHIEI